MNGLSQSILRFSGFYSCHNQAIQQIRFAIVIVMWQSQRA